MIIAAALDVLGPVGAGIGIIGGLGAALALFRVSYQRTQLELVRSDRDDLAVRVKNLEAEVLRWETEGARKDGQISSLETQVAVLRDTVTAKPAVDELTDLVRKQVVAPLAHIEAVIVEGERPR